MARIPTAENVQQIRPGQLPQVRVSQAAAGVDVYRAQQERGQTLGRVGQVLEEQAIRFREEEDVANARAATTEYAEVVQRLNYGDPNDPNSGQGYYSLTGNAALQARALYEESLEKEYQRIADSLQSKGARRRFEQVGTTRKMSALDGGARFAAQQLKVYSQATAEGERKALTMEAISDPHNNQDQLTAIAMSVRAQLHKDLGHPDDASPEKRAALHKTIEAAVTAAQTEAHLGAIDTLLSSQSATAAADAEAYFKKHKSDIAPDKRDDVERALKDQTLLEKSQQATDEVMAGGGGWNAMHARAKKLPPEIRKEVRANLDRERTRQRLAKNDWEDAALAQATRAIQGGMSPAQLAKQNPQVFNAVAEHVESLWRMHDANIRRNTYAPTSDYITFRELARLPTPKLRRLNVALHQHLLTKGEADTLYALQTQLDTTVEKKAIAPEISNAGIAVLRSIAPGKRFSWAEADAGTSKETNARNAELYMTSLIQEYVTREQDQPTRKDYEAMALQSIRMFSSAPPNTQFFSMVPAEGEENVEPFAASNLPAIKALSEQQRDYIVAESLEFGVRNEKAYQLFLKKIREEPGVTYSDELMKRLLGALFIGNRKIIQQLLPTTSGYGPPPEEAAPRAEQVLPGVTER